MLSRMSERHREREPFFVSFSVLGDKKFCDESFTDDLFRIVSVGLSFFFLLVFGFEPGFSSLTARISLNYRE